MRPPHVLTQLLFALCFAFGTSAQSNNPGRTDRLYTSSGIGFSLPVGETNEYFGPKFSTTLGVNLGLGKSGLFLYPKVSLHAFEYDQQILDPGFNLLFENSRATTYLLNVALGYRKMVGRFGYYGFIGTGGGFLLTPQVKLTDNNRTATVSNKNNAMTMLESGLGIEYSLGKLSLFLESSFMNGFNKIEGRRFQSVPISIGIKPNLSSILNDK